jgi:hypothetical protein
MSLKALPLGVVQTRLHSHSIIFWSAVIGDPQGHDDSDPGESVSKRGKQGAIAEAGVRGCLDRAKKLLDLALDKCRRLAFGSRKFLGLDFPRRIHCEHSFFGQPGKQHPDRGHVLFDRGRRGFAVAA